MIQVLNDRRVFPNNVTISNQYENDTRTIQFDLSDVEFTGNTYLICKYQNNTEFYNPLLLDENFSIPVETFLSAQAGSYSCVLAISTATIDENYDFSTDNPLFVSNVFTLNVQANFLTGTSTAWGLTPAAQNYFDQLIALVNKVQSDLDSGAFNGNGIQSIQKISTSGLIDTYQITFTNGSTFDYEVTNGEMPVITIQNGNWYVNDVDTGQSALGVGVPAGGTEGQILSKKSNSDYDTEWVDNEGQSINSVQVSVSNTTGVPSATGSVSNGVLTLDFQNLKGETPTIAIQDGYWYVNGENTGQQAQGQQGVGIESIEKTSTQGNVDTYTITFTNQTTTTYTVTNGTNGATPNIQIGDVTTLQPDQQATASITGTPENPLLNLGIPQGQAGGEGEWQLIQDITIEEEVSTFEITQNSESQPFSLKEIYVLVLSIGSENNTSSSNKNAYLIVSGESAGFIGNIALLSGVTRALLMNIKVNPTFVCNYFIINSFSYVGLFTNNAQNIGAGTIFGDNTIPDITSLKIQLQACVFGVGSRIQVFGR